MRGRYWKKHMMAHEWLLIQCFYFVYLIKNIMIFGNKKVVWYGLYTVEKGVDEWYHFQTCLDLGLSQHEEFHVLIRDRFIAIHRKNLYPELGGNSEESLLKKLILSLFGAEATWSIRVNLKFGNEPERITSFLIKLFEETKFSSINGVDNIMNVIGKVEKPGIQLEGVVAMDHTHLTGMDVVPFFF
ncbi:hypothetical protein ACJX0J_040807, partial [Zea mays]